jgi:hypothetical protein
MSQKSAPGAQPEDKAAASQGEHTPTPEQTEDTIDTADMSAEQLRHHAVGRLAEYLDYGSSLVEHCEHMAALPKGDRLAPVYAAAKLMSANARVALAFAAVAELERRRRTIVEHIQPAVAKMTDSNSTLGNKLEQELRLKMLRYMTLIASEKLDPALKDAPAAPPS